MDSITLIFTQAIQASTQVGDTIYYTNDLNGDTIVKIGLVTSLDFSNNTIVAEIPASTIRPTLTSFILFSKTNAANLNSIAGYYLETELRNDSTEEIELFSVGTEIFESSN